ncbi:MAG TPA: PepSY domain-containing protein [Candidatus Eisenbacteria bacterium]|nr:PepSY domain-containing protein [Candidatus Eisenbacteria bacterium]
MSTRHTTLLTLALLGTLAVAAIAIADKEAPVPQADYGKAAAAAVAAAGGGTVTSVDRDRERGAVWEVEVTKADGTRVDVLLDAAFKAIDVSPEREAMEKPRKAAARAAAPSTGAPAPDVETPVPTADAERAGQAALKAVGSGTVQDVDRDSEGGAVWEVEILKADGTQVDVLLDASFKVLSLGGEQEQGEGDDDQSDDRD